jgi:hypothetical protein
VPIALATTDCDYHARCQCRRRGHLAALPYIVDVHCAVTFHHKPLWGPHGTPQAEPEGAEEQQSRPAHLEKPVCLFGIPKKVGAGSAGFLARVRVEENGAGTKLERGEWYEKKVGAEWYEPAHRTRW